MLLVRTTEETHDPLPKEGSGEGTCGEFLLIIDEQPIRPEDEIAGKDGLLR